MSLILRKPDLQISLTGEAEQLKSDALERAALIGKVTNAHEQEIAVQACAAIKSVLDLIEKARNAAKAPLLEAGRSLDATCKAFRKELEDEWGRINYDLIGEFQRQERRRMDEEKRKQEEELRAIEAAKQLALTKAKTEADKEAITQTAAMHVAHVQSTPVTPTLAKGQSVRDDWTIEVTNPYELAKFHPDCVDIKERLGPIKALLNQGVQVKGVKATKVIRPVIRATPQQKVLDVATV